MYVCMYEKQKSVINFPKSFSYYIYISMSLSLLGLSYTIQFPFYPESNFPNDSPSCNRFTHQDFTYIMYDHWLNIFSFTIDKNVSIKRFFIQINQNMDQLLSVRFWNAKLCDFFSDMLNMLVCCTRDLIFQFL